jgi:hypothetical protein
MRILKDVGDVLSFCMFGGTAKGKLLACITAPRCNSPTLDCSSVVGHSLLCY